MEYYTSTFNMRFHFRNPKALNAVPVYEHVESTHEYFCSENVKRIDLDWTRATNFSRGLPITIILLKTLKDIQCLPDN